MRIGLNTGAAVVGKVEDVADAGVTVLGDTVNFAARLQALAEPDTVFLSEATHRLLQGMVEVTFAGDHQIKGKAEPQKTYRLDAIRQGAARFEAAVSRGLSTFVGRERELEVLERGLDKARSQLCVIDLVAEPGMGKSRLLHEFRQRIDKDRAFILSGSCSPDGQQTPFLPFIEVVRGSFRVSAGEAEKDIAQKLEMGLTALALHSVRNIGLLLHLLGLRVPDDALAGLDGLLIGLHTRELLQQLLEARCRLSPVVMVIEDLHWIDSASEELLGKIIDSEAKLRLLLLTTRRPEYAPPWLDRPTVTKLPLEPLPTGDIHHLVRARLGVEALPEPLARQVTEKAEGNPLFAEEIVSFLSETGVLRARGGELDFAASDATVLPASVQSLLTTRVDRLAAEDRALLQAAAVIGRQFNPHLLSVVVGETDVGARLQAMQALDLLRIETKSSDYAFKHALLRDALYQSLLSDARAALHLSIAQEIERRSGNRLTEVAEILAHHYSQTDRASKAFSYLVMAGTKSLSVYSLGEAANHFGAALALLDKDANYASDEQVADFLVSYAELLNISDRVNTMIDVFSRYLARIDRLGDDTRVLLIRHQCVMALIMAARYREAAALQPDTLAMADRLGDDRSKAYALSGEIWLSSLVAPKSQDDMEVLKRAAIEACSGTTDAFLQSHVRWMIGWDEMLRGRMNHARDAARDLMQAGQMLNDPRSTGFGLWLLSWVAVASDSYAEALRYSEEAFAASVTPQDRKVATSVKGIALVLLRRIDEGTKLLEEVTRQSIVDGMLYTAAGPAPFLGLSKILRGNFGEGIRSMEEVIAKRDEEGARIFGDFAAGFLSEVYLQIIAGNEKPPFGVLLKNLPVLLTVMFTGPSRIRALSLRILRNPYFDPTGHPIARAQMILGLLCKAKNKRALAVQHLSQAKRILSQFGQTPILARVETALAELGQ